MVRAIPYGVGRYEAQVFNFNQIYKTLAAQEEARRKANLETKKELEKSLVDLSTQKAKGRTQDLAYLNGLQNELNAFYSDNARNITPGTDSYKKLNELKSNFIFEVQRSVNAKEQGKEMLTYASVNADKDRLADESTNIVSMQQKPINDPVWNTFKYKRQDGSEVGLSDLGTMDLQKLARYKEEDTRKAIEGLDYRTTESAAFTRNYLGTNVPEGTMVSKKISFRDPIQLIGTFDSQYRGTQDAIKYWDDQWNSLSKEEKDRTMTLYAELPKVYKAAGLDVDIQQVENADGKAGISSGYEYGQVKFLLQNLPKEVGQSIDYRLANYYQDEKYKNRMLAFRKETKIKENLDTGLAKNILNPDFKLKDYANSINNITGLSGTLTGFKYRPAQIRNIDETNKTITVDLSFPILQGEKNDKPVKDYNTAVGKTQRDTYANESKKKLKGGPKEWISKDVRGNWLKVRRVTFDVNPNTNPGYAQTIGDMNNQIQEAIKLGGNDDAFKYFQTLRSAGATMTPVGGEVENIFMNL